jgi:RNA polymerase sigma-70 factor (ECF subfamily)
MALAVAPSPSPDDVSLAEAIARGDAGALEQLMRRHNQRLFRVARAILKDDDEAEDAVQDAYIAAYRAIGTFRATAKLSTWLTRIAINECYGRLRSRKRDAVVFALPGSESTGHDNEVIVENQVDGGEQPEDSASRGQLRAVLERTIDALPEQFRAVFILREVEELTVEETAACLDLPEATVRTRAFRARALLRESLARDLDAATLDAFHFAGERCDRIVGKVLHAIATLPPQPKSGPPA